MKIKVISYSYTGNNEAFAAGFAEEIGAEHIRITEPKKRTAGKIVREKLFNKDPEINLSAEEISEGDFAIFFGPFWFGKIASPLRSYFKQLNNKSFDYGFVSLCVGFEDPAAIEDLKCELGNIIGKDPEFIVLNKIADLLPPQPKPSQKMLTQYQINHNDLRKLVSSTKNHIGTKAPW